MSKAIVDQLGINYYCMKLRKLNVISNIKSNVNDSYFYSINYFLLLFLIIRDFLQLETTCIE